MVVKKYKSLTDKQESALSEEVISKQNNFILVYSVWKSYSVLLLFCLKQEVSLEN